MTDVIGWVSSIVLLATIVSQIAKQWSERSGEGVSTWLFIGQTVASVGFTAYSALAKNWVFTVTNGLMLVSAILGWGITAHFRRQSPRPATTPVAQSRARHVLRRPVLLPDGGAIPMARRPEAE